MRFLLCLLAALICGSASAQAANIHYMVLSTPGSDAVDLNNALHDIAAAGGHAISVLHVPNRMANGTSMGAGYVIVGEYPGP